MLLILPCKIEDEWVRKGGYASACRLSYARAPLQISVLKYAPIIPAYKAMLSQRCIIR